MTHLEVEVCQDLGRDAQGVPANNENPSFILLLTNSLAE
jgi:hypothetical protein